MVTDAPRMEAKAFHFRSTNAKITGGVAGGLLIVFGLAWGSLTGRIREPSAMYWGAWGLAALVVAVLLWRGHRASVRHAIALGHIELDATGLRWLRADQTVVVDFPWSRVVEAVVEKRTSTIVVVLHPEGPESAQVAMMLGEPSGYVRFDNFEAFLLEFQSHCAVKEPVRAGAHSRWLAKKSFVSSTIFAATSVLLLWINGLLEVRFDLRHALPVAPYGLGFLAFVYALAGLALWRGPAPSVSYLNDPKFWVRRLPLVLALLVLINFLLVWILSL